MNDAVNEYKLERDPKDEKYINLAIITRAEYIVTFDKDLLDLMKEDNQNGRSFRQKYPFLKIINPIDFISIIETQRHEIDF